MVHASASLGKFSERQVWSPAPELLNPNLHFNHVFRRFVCTWKFEKCLDGLPDSGLVPKSVPSRFFLLSFITDCLLDSQAEDWVSLSVTVGGSQTHPLLSLRRPVFRLGPGQGQQKSRESQLPFAFSEPRNRRPTCRTSCKFERMVQILEAQIKNQRGRTGTLDACST